MEADIKLDDLIKIKEAISERWGKNAYEYIGECGLELEIPPRHEFYSCTPKNTLTFASTGGDGVHYSLLVDEDGSPQDGPVVMTVPMAFEEDINTVIAENLREFLGLGYHVGWFSLEQIVYQNPIDFAYYSKPDPDFEEEEIRFLNLIKELFQVEYVALTADRLAYLHEKYFHLLKINLEDWS